MSILTAALADAGLDPGEVQRIVRTALDEDLRFGPDVTTAATVPPGTVATADVVARAQGVVAGLPVVMAVLDAAGLPVDGIEVVVPDGGTVAPGDVVATIRAPLAGLLSAERTLLNLLTHLSGIASATRSWVDAVAGTGCVVRDTRKTLPGLREIEKYAVRCGGGANHRMGLGDAALIKDNHVIAAGGITEAIRSVRRTAPDRPMEVECDTLAQVDEAMAAGADLILLDNMAPADLRAAVAAGTSYPEVRFEASGGLRIDNVADVAATGVHFVAVGALTHSSPALDLGLDLRDGPAVDPEAVTLRRMVLADLDRVEAWMGEPHVAEWYLSASSVEEEMEDVRQSLRDDEPTEVLVVVRGGRPVGWCQWYPCAAYPDHAAGVGAQPGDIGIDYAIGDPALVGRGVGTALVAALVAHVRARHPGAGIIADPEAAHLASRRVLEHNGFVLIGERPVPSERSTAPMAIYRLP
jgi:nicotinate-nucleotide pyrophosphorylase (carboxylating)